MKTSLTGLMTLALGLLVVAVWAADKRVDDAVARADAQLQRGKPDEALKILEKTASQTPGPEAYAALARMQQRVGKLDDAATSAAKAVELSVSAAPPARSEALATLAALDLARGSSRDALTHAEEAAKLDATPAALSVLARAQARVQGGAVALQTVERVAPAGNGAAVHEARGEALLAMGRNDEAVAAARKALEADPQLTSARVLLANALLAQGKNAEAVAEAKKATEANPQSDEAFAVYGLAILAENPKNWNDAIAQAQQGAFLNPRNPVVQVAVGKIFEAQGNLDQATAAYRKAVEVDPANTGARRALIVLQMRRGELDAALAEARKLAADAPQSGEAQLQLGRLLMRKNEFNEAVKPLEQAAALSPGIAEAHALLGTAYHYVGKPAEAAAAYKKAVELDPKNVEYRTMYGLLLGLTEQYEPGIAELKKVIATPGYKDAAAWANIGWIYRNMKPPRLDEAVNAYKKAAELDPKNAQVALGLAWAYLKANRFDDAIAAYNRVRELDPKMEGEAETGLAWVYAFKKDVAQARAHADKAKATGRNVAPLKTQIDRVEKGLAAEEKAAEEEAAAPPVQRGPDVGSLTQVLLYSHDVNAQVRAARQLVSFGATAVPSLINALTQGQAVREAAVAALGAIGPPAKAAVPHLKHILSTREHEKINMTKEEMQASMREEDFRRAVRDAILRIEG